MTTREGLVAAILAAPDDDLPRLVFADWLEENGEADRAAWIRIQCELERTMPDRRPWYIPGNWPDKVRPTSRQNLERHIWAKAVESEMVLDWFKVFAHNSVSEAGVGIIWGDDQMSDTDDDDGTECPRATIRRGFVSEVHCTLADWCGDDGGEPILFESPAADYGVVYPSRLRRAGIGPQIVRRHPVERVVLVDREPWQTGNRWSWWTESTAETRPYEVASSLPQDVFRLMHGHNNYYTDSRAFPTREDADKAMSAALIAWAKSVTPGESGVQQRTEELA